MKVILFILLANPDLQFEIKCDTLPECHKALYDVIDRNAIFPYPKCLDATFELKKRARDKYWECRYYE